MTEIRSRIVIQDDWDTALKYKDAKIWIGYKKHGSKTIYSELKRNFNVLMEDNDNENHIDENLRGNRSDFNAKLLKNRRGSSHVETRPESFQYLQYQRHLKLTYQTKLNDDNDDDNDNVSDSSFEVVFKAADQIFNKIHTPRKTVNCLDVTRGGLGVSCDSDGCVKVWLPDDGEVRRQLIGHCGEVYTSKYFPSGLVVLTGGADTQLKIWSVEDGKCGATLKGHQQGVTDTSIIERGRNVVSASRDGTIKLWDCSQSNCLHTFDWLDSGPINACHLMGAWFGLTLGPPNTEISDKEILTDGKVLLVATERHRLISLGLQNRQKIFSYDCASPTNCCTNISEYIVLAGCDDSTVHVLDVRKISTPVKVLQESRSAILSILPYKQGCFISTGDGSCYYMDENLKTTKEFTGPDSICTMSFDDKYLYTGCKDGCVRKYRIN